MIFYKNKNEIQIIGQSKELKFIRTHFLNKKSK